MSGLGGQDHVCEKSSRQEKGTQEHEEASQIGVGFVQACRQSEAQSTRQAAAEIRDVSQAYERQKALDQAGAHQVSIKTIREEDDRYRTQEAGRRPGAAASTGA
ncbi:MAG TPA: hypothetical protein VIQ99_01915, partial [Gammaproteobacteria bacterium]